jgi:outer membrane protein assembly factor BamB/tetratricopeptide (TPR) repeat protein
MGFRGSLESINLADIFQNLAMNQQSGTLTLTAEDRIRYVYFSKGEVKFVSAGHKTDLPLLAILRGRRLIDDEAVRSVEEYVATAGCGIPQGLTETGTLKREPIDEILRYIIEESVYDLFGWETAVFEFNEGPPDENVFDTTASSEIRMSTSNLIMEAARRIDDWAKIRRVIPTTSEVFVLDAAGLEAFKASEMFGGNEAIVIDLVDGTRDIEDVCRESWFSRFDVCQTLLMLLQYHAVRSASRKDLTDAVAACRERGDTPQVIKLYERLLSLYPQDGTIRRELALACASAGQKDKAANHYNALAESVMQAGNAVEAMVLYRQILEWVPRHPPSRRKLAAAAEKEGRTEEAVEHYRVLAEFHIAHDQFEAVRDACVRALDLRPDDAELRHTLARAFLGLGDKPAAIAELTRLADRLREQGESRRAADMYRRILSIDANRPDIKEKLAKVIMSEDARTRRNRMLAVAVVAAAVIGAAVAGAYVRDRMIYSAFQKEAEEVRQLNLGTSENDKEINDAIQRIRGRAELFTFFFNKMRTEGDEEVQNLRDQIEHLRAVADKKRQERQKSEDDQVSQYEEQCKAGDLEGALKTIERFLKQDISLERRTMADNARKEIWKELSVIRAFREEQETGWRNDIKAERRAKIEFFNKYPNSPDARKIKIPLRVVTDPPGCSIQIVNALKENAKPEDAGLSPVVIYHAPGAVINIFAEHKGYFGEPRHVTTDRQDSEEISLSLRRLHLQKSDIRGHVTAPLVAADGKIIVCLQGANGVDVAALMAGDINRASPWKLTLSKFNFDAIQAQPVLFHPRGLSPAEDPAETQIIVAAGQRIYALKLTDGQTVWTYPGQGKFNDAPAIAKVALMRNEYYAFVAGQDRQIHCVSLTTHTEAEGWTKIWHKQHITSGVAAGSRYIYAANANQCIIAYNIATGETEGSWNLSSIADVTPVLSPDEKTLWVAAQNGVLYSLNADNPAVPKVEMALRTGAAIQSAPVLDAAAHMVFVTSKDGKCYALDTETHRTWSAPEENFGPITGGPCVTPARVYVATERERGGGVIIAIDRATGKTLWTYKAEAESTTFRATPAFYQNILYVAGTDGTIYTFDESDAASAPGGK